MFHITDALNPTRNALVGVVTSNSMKSVIRLSKMQSTVINDCTNIASQFLSKKIFHEKSGFVRAELSKNAQ